MHHAHPIHAHVYMCIRSAAHALKPPNASYTHCASSGSCAHTPSMHHTHPMCICARSAARVHILPMRHIHPTCICAGAHTVLHVRTSSQRTTQVRAQGCTCPHPPNAGCTHYMQVRAVCAPSQCTIHTDTTCMFASAQAVPLVRAPSQCTIHK